METNNTQNQRNADLSIARRRHRKLAEAWENLSPEVRDAIAILIDKFLQQD